MQNRVLSHGLLCSVSSQHSWCTQHLASNMNSQERILMSLIQGQEGKAWAMDKKGWKEDSNYEVCKWDYIICDSYQTTVIGIDMVEEDFVGTLPSALGNLLTLQEISMRRNLIIGTIPKSIANLPHLEKLFLSENRLTGTIPNFASYKLKTLDLAYNLLSGTLNPSFAYFNPSLTELDLASNKLKGTLPSFLSQNNNLKLVTLSLSENEFSGTIHSFLSSVPSLSFLYLDGNFLMGTIPTEFSGSSSGMRELWLQNNELTGTIPAAIGEMPDLFNFYIDGNKLTGTVPKSLCRAEVNEDFFQNVPGNPKERDYCDSIACPSGKVSLEGVYPCKDCMDQFFNPYLGRVDQCIDLVELDILKTFYEATAGDLWTNMESSWVIQDKLYCSLEGITCTNNGKIIAIDLKGKGLRGTIPEEIGYLRFLERLDLSDNYLTGILPSDLRWAPLQFLDVSGNRIKGIIPYTLCRKEGINGNGHNGLFDCNLIQCPAGFHSHIGRATVQKPCKPCPHGADTPFIGSMRCSTLFHQNVFHYAEDPALVIPIAFFMLSFTFTYIYCLKEKYGKHNLLSSDGDSENGDGKPTSCVEENGNSHHVKPYKDTVENSHLPTTKEQEEEDDDDDSDDDKSHQTDLIKFGIDDDHEDDHNLIQLHVRDNNKGKNEKDLLTLDVDEDSQKTPIVNNKTKNIIDLEENAGSEVDKESKSDEGMSRSSRLRRMNTIDLS